MKKILFFFGALLIISGAINAQSITISEINYKSAASLNSDDWFELHNFGSSTVDISGWVMRDSLATSPYTFPSGTLMSAGSYLVVYRNQLNFFTQFPTITNAIGPFAFKISSFDSLILKDASNNVVVKAVVNSNKYWPDGADGEGRTMQLINEITNVGLIDSIAWRDGCMRGSPGTAPAACNDPIIFSEINYNNDSTRKIGEFVELYNTTNANFDLSGWMIKDDTDFHIFTFPVGTIIPAGGYIMVNNDTAAFKKYNTWMPNFYGPFNFSLKNSGEQIRLFDPNGILKFSMHYRDTIPWTDSAAGKGYTLEILNKAGRTNDPKNWFAGCPGGSPGVAYTPLCKPFYPLGITNNLKNKISVYPTNVSDVMNIYGLTDDCKYIQILDAMGKQLQQKKVQSANESMAVDNLVKGIYFVQIVDNFGIGYTYTIVKQ